MPDISAVYWRHYKLRELGGFGTSEEARRFLDEQQDRGELSPVGIDVDGTLLPWIDDDLDAESGDPRKEYPVVRD